LYAVRVGLLADDWPLMAGAAQARTLVGALTHDISGTSNGSAHFYRPVWTGTFYLAMQLFGPGNTSALHGMVIALFGLLTLEVWMLARSLSPGISSTVVAVLFATYPQHQETVAWLGGSSDVFAACFGLAALLALGQTRLGLWRYALAAFLAFIAALSKESAFVVAPLAVLAAVAWSRRPVRASDPRLYLGAAAVLAGQACRDGRHLRRDGHHPAPGGLLPGPLDRRDPCRGGRHDRMAVAASMAQT
jgi:hypothetical protein